MTPDVIPLVDLQAQYISIRPEIDPAVSRLLSSCQFILGPAVETFEREFAAFVGCRHCVSVASGTDAIHLMLRAFGIGPGDEVIIPAFTFVATALGVSLAGATPVLADVGGHDALLDPTQIEKAITKRTKAIIAVHLYGQCADIPGIAELARSRSLLVFEDAAQAHGATCNGRAAGGLGAAAAFSFYPGKNLGAYGDGGAITTNRDDIADRLRLLRNWGSRKKYHHDEFGLNSRLDALQAAILSVKLRHLPEWNAARARHAAYFRESIPETRGLRHVTLHPRGQSAHHLFVVRVPRRDEILAFLNSRGIQAAIHYPFPVHRLGAYRHLLHENGSFPQAEAWGAECLSLPLYPELSRAQLDRIVSTLNEAVSKHAHGAI
jgi:dTDP-4-amino-4,6-dideoxygalactose transaminase